jgi:hypothetical protein
MSRAAVGRNDPCPCGSGKKFKKCCLLPAGSRPGIPAWLWEEPARSLFGGVLGPSAGSTAPQQYPTRLEDRSPKEPANEPPEEPADEPKPPPLDSVPLLPVEVGLDYTYPEPLGEAEVSFRFPAGKTFLLEDDEPILVEDLKAGHRVQLKEGQIGTIRAVRVSYHPPEPPTHYEDGRVLSRVIGTIKHKGRLFSM